MLPAARRTTPVCLNSLKLGVVTSIRYVPGLRFEASKRPCESVPTAAGTPVASSTTRTAASATPAPCGSMTVPSDGAEEGLGVSGSGNAQEGQEQDQEDPSSHHLLLDKCPITARDKRRTTGFGLAPFPVPRTK
jgi:hypothetical protein